MAHCRFPWAVYPPLFSTGLFVALLTFLPVAHAGTLPHGKAVSGARPAAATERAPERLDDARVLAFVAGLSDEQARQHLIDALKTSSPQEQVREDRPSGFSGAILRIGAITDRLHTRLQDLHSGARAVPDFVPRFLADVPHGEGPFSIPMGLMRLAAMIAAGVAGEWLFRRGTARLRQALAQTAPTTTAVKMNRLFLRGLVDLAAIGVFATATLAVFFMCFDDGGFRRLRLLTYLTVALAIRAVGLVSDFFLAPSAPALRLLPLDDPSAASLHRWIMSHTVVAGGGLLLIGFMELENASEALVVLTGALTGMAVAVMLTAAIMKHRQPIAGLLANRPDEASAGAVAFRLQLAGSWHCFAVPYVLIGWALWLVYLLHGGADLLMPVLALWIGPLLFLAANEILRQLLDALPGLPVPPAHGPQPAELPRPLSRSIPLVRQGLSLCLFGATLFWILRLWGFDVGVGQEVIRAAIQIGMAAIVFTSAWRFAEAAISRKLEGMGESYPGEPGYEVEGEGGSRMFTLLQLLRRFLGFLFVSTFALIALSAVGVDIKPLLAGAGVVGLAVGFGSQTLVKDIISGIFYLVDDAFRIGDYIDTGKLKGTVEHISIRSVRLRHHRGMVRTIPFSGLGSVTNYSRDYLIEKLDFRVPFGTDVRKVKKIVKGINKEVEQDEELGPKLLAPIKCIGVKEFDDSGMVMRVKCKTRPGDPFIIRREVFARLQSALKAQGIEFAHRRVIVGTPPEWAGELKSTGAPIKPERSGVLPAGAAAAVSVALIEEEAKRKEVSEA